MDKEIELMQQALDSMVEKAMTNKSTQLADAIDHLAIALEYARGL